MKKSLRLIKALSNIKVFCLDNTNRYICYFPNYKGVDTISIISDLFSIIPGGIRFQKDSQNRDEIGVCFEADSEDIAASLCKIATLRIELAYNKAS